MRFDALNVGDYFSKEKCWPEDVYMKVYPLSDHEFFQWNAVCIAGYTRSMFYEFAPDAEVLYRETI